jgi:hypothetical protein
MKNSVWCTTNVRTVEQMYQTTRRYMSNDCNLHSHSSTDFRFRTQRPSWGKSVSKLSSLSHSPSRACVSLKGLRNVGSSSGNHVCSEVVQWLRVKIIAVFTQLFCHLNQGSFWPMRSPVCFVILTHINSL